MSHFSSSSDFIPALQPAASYAAAAAAVAAAAATVLWGLILLQLATSTTIPDLFLLSLVLVEFFLET